MSAATPASMPGQHPPPTPASTPAMATPADAAPVPVNSRHHSKNMMHSSSVKRDSNFPGLDSEIVKFHDAASKQNQKIDKNSVEQKDSQKLNFSIDAILNKNHQKEKIPVQTKNKEKRIMQNLQLTTSMDSNTDPKKTNHCRTSGGDIVLNEPTARYTSEFMPNPVRSNSDQIKLHQIDKNNDLDPAKKILLQINRKSITAVLPVIILLKMHLKRITLQN